MNSTWNPWKLTAIGMALVMVTALVTGLVVAQWRTPAATAKDEPAQTAPAKPAARLASTSRPATSGAPTQTAVNACNQHAASQVGSQDKTMEVVKDAAIGAVVGAAVGAAGGAIADGGKGAGQGAAIGAVVGAGGGTLYGINENRKHDERYRAAYGSCMRSRGYTT